MVTVTQSSPASYFQSNFATIHDSRTNPELTVAVDTRGNVLPIGGARNFKSGVTNPGWRDRIAKHVDASSPYTREIWQEITPGVLVGRTRTKRSGVTAGYKVEGYARNQSVLGTMTMVGMTDASLQNTALTRLKNNLRQQTSEANVMAPIAELGELRGLIRQSIGVATELLEAIQQIRKKGSTRKAEKLIKDLWLAFNFGIRPLVGDVEDAAAAVAAFIHRSDLTLHIHGSASRDSMFSYEPNFATISAVPFGAEVVGDGAGYAKLKYRYKGAFNSNLRSANNYDAFDALGIKLENVPYTLWELTGLSWIVDYFTNVGTYLEDRFYCPSGNLVYLNLTRSYEVTMNNFASYKVINGNPSNVDLLHTTNAVSTVRYKEVQRQVLAALPHVALDFYSLDTVGKNALSKLLNLVAITRRR